MEQNNGWTAEETRQLFNLVAKVNKEGKGLRHAFAEMAQKTNRKTNSVRNYYYAQAKTFSLLPEMSQKLGIKNFTAPKKADFTPFSTQDVDHLVDTILIEQAKGKSVRAITYQLANNDPTIMLRLQNKYRSMMFCKKGYAAKKIAELKARKATFYNPLTKQVITNGIEPQDGNDSQSNADLRTFLHGLARLMGADNQETQSLRAELEQLKQQMEQAKTQESLQSQKLREINRFFLNQADKDKIQALGDYVSELGKILETVKG